MSMLWKANFYCINSIRLAIASLFRGFRARPRPTHIIFCMVDHYEPGTGNVTRGTEEGRVENLLRKFPKLVDCHRDSSGNVPKRTWFFPPHYHRYHSLKKLVSLCEGGYGEIELHLHHGKIRPDSPENLTRTIMQCIEEYSYFGIFGCEDGRKRYGFIHGDWALNNSRKGQFCGVDNEIEILGNTGCYADFTFPCFNEANPLQINSIYYAKNKTYKRKCYNRGTPVRVGSSGRGNLMIIQGPLHLFFKERKLLGLRIFRDSIDGTTPVTGDRIKMWVETCIHVKGKRDWVIVKVSTHGAAYEDAVLGKEMDSIYDYLEGDYNDGCDYILHYVSARELYNIIKAAEAGEEGGNPEEYRNYKISAPSYDSSARISEASDTLKSMVASTYR